MADPKKNNPVPETAANIGRKGTLYVVGTPIGNLEDMTFRALRVLKAVDLVAAESVERTKGLCRHYGIATKVARYNQHNFRSRGPELIKRLQSGHDIALVTDAGTPGISDPGGMLVALARAEGLPVTAIPGPSAVTAALSICGLPADRFLFQGFLPTRAGKRHKELEQLRTEKRTMIFFEAPHRILDTLGEMLQVLGDKEVVITRELTKVFEQVEGGPLSGVLKRLKESPLLGEFTIVVEGGGGRNEAPATSCQELGMEIDRLLKERKGAKAVAEFLSLRDGLPYRKIYRECLARLQHFQKVGQNGCGSEFEDHE